ncbi:MAG: transcriptional coactivator p15/PC4 family protein [Candidatus Acidoferrales bacterium]
MADDQIEVGAFPKNNREDVRVTFSKFKGYDLLGVRVWYRTDNDELRPSKSGVTIRVDLLPELLSLLQQAKKVAIEKGLLDKEDFEEA